MTSAFAAPLIVRADQPVQKLEPVPLTGGAAEDAYSEAWLQKLLYGHPQALPIAEIDDSFAGAVPVCRELGTPVGPIDVLYVTPGGRLVVVEAKLWRNPEARRKVIGQILDYAKELSRWSYERLDAAVRSARRSEDGACAKGLADVVGLVSGSEEASRFFDAVSQGLRRGDLLLLIVGDGIREGVGAITEFLEGHASLHFTFGLVEMAIFRLPEGGQLVQPRVLAKSEIIRRTVVELRDGQMRVQEEDDASAESDRTAPELTASRERFRRFWTEFITKLRLDDQSQPISPPASGPNQYFQMPSGSNAWISAYLHQSAGRAGVYLSFSKGAVGDRLYAALSADRAEIETSLGVPIVWESDGHKHWIVSRQTYEGSLIEDHGAEIQAMMADRVNRYVNVFRPRLAKLIEGTGTAL